MAPTRNICNTKQKPYNFTTDTLKGYLSAQASSLSACVISKVHTSGQKPRGRQLNAKVCGHEIAIFRILLPVQPSIFQPQYLENGLSTHRHFSTKLILITKRSYTTYRCLHSFKPFTTLCGCCSLRRSPFSNVVRMRTCSLVPIPNTTIIDLRTRLVHQRNR